MRCESSGMKLNQQLRVVRFYGRIQSIGRCTISNSQVGFSSASPILECSIAHNSRSPRCTFVVGIGTSEEQECAHKWKGQP